METNDDVHVVLVDGVVDDVGKSCLLTTSVKLAARNFDPGSVRGGNANGVDSELAHLVDVCLGDEGVVAGLKLRTTGGETDSSAPRPFINVVATYIGGPPSKIVVLSTPLI